MAEFLFKSRVSYDDVDHELKLTLRGAMGLMQEAAIVHSNLVGYSVYDIPRTHVVWMLVHWRIRLVSSAKWNDDVVVKTWPRTMERVTSERDFEIVGSDGRIIAIGESAWVLVSADTGRIIRIPPEVSNAYELTERKAFQSSLQEIGATSKSLSYEGKVLKCNIDSNHHVNNRVYLDYACEALPDHTVLDQFSEIHVHYRKQLVCNDEIRCYYGENAGNFVVDVCSTDEKDIRATVELFV